MVAIAGTGWKLAPSLVAYVKEADRYYPQRDRSSDGSIGDLAHQARGSDHNPAGGLVHAVDLDEDLAPGLDLKAFAEKLRRGRDPRVKYVIYEGRMFSSYATVARAAWAWGPYSGTNAHLHHLHLSILDTYAAEHDLSAWGFAPPAPEPAPPPPIEEPSTVMSYYHVVPTGRFYCVRPWSPAVAALTPAQAYELAAGGVKFVKVVELSTWTAIAAGAPK
jgi:hypothetical protein